MDEQMTSQLEEFKEFLKKRGASNNTIASYLSTVRLYFSLSPQIDLMDLQKFKTYLLEHFQIGRAHV